MIQNAYKAVRGMLSGIDPHNVDSDISPKDLDIQRPEPTEDERDIVRLVKERFNAASSTKELHVREWLICQAFRMGNHWVEWRRGELFDTRDPDDNKRNYSTIDVIDHLLRKLKARATMSKPDASVKPLTSSELDKLASAEARDVLAHYDDVFNRQEQSLEWVDSVLSSSTTFLKIIWDPAARVLAPTTAGPAELQALGEIDEIIVPPFEIYPDPAARDWKEVTWLIHAKDRPLSYIQAKYGKRGYLVDGKTQRSDSTNWADQRLDNFSGDSILPANSDEKTATVYECWELPSARYPKGRLLRVAGDILLTEPNQLDWPYTKNDEFPFVPLTYERRPRGLWSLNAVTRLIKPQVAFNKAISRMQDRVDNDKVLILEPRGAETGADNDYTSPSAMTRIKHEQGFVPQLFQPSPFNEALLSYANFIKAQMEDIAGVHEVSNGSVPAGVTAGNAIELLQQSDQTQMSEFVTCIEGAQKKRAQWEIALVSQYYSEPRLIAVSQLPMQSPQAGPPAPAAQAQPGQPPQLPGISPAAGQFTFGAPLPGTPAMAPQAPPGPPQPPQDSGTMSTAVMAVKSFEGLTSGGQVHISIVPGSATPKTPAAQSQQILDLAAKGFFSPQMLPVLKLVADQLGLARSDTFTDRIDEAYAKIMANTPPPEVAAGRQQAAQQAADADKLRSDQAHAAQVEAIQVQGKIELDNAQTANKIKIVQASAAADAQARAILSQKDHEEALAEQQNEHHHEAALQHVDKVIPSATITVPLKPGVNVSRSAAEVIGLTPDDPAEIKSLNAPKPPTSPGGKPGAGPSQASQKSP